MNYNIENIPEKKFKTLLWKTLELDLKIIYKNYDLVVQQMVNAELAKLSKSGYSIGYGKIHYNHNGYLRLCLMKALYSTAIFIKTDQSGPTRKKAKILYEY